MRQLRLFPPEIVLENGRVCSPLPIGVSIIILNDIAVDSVTMLVDLRRRRMVN